MILFRFFSFLIWFKKQWEWLKEKISLLPPNSSLFLFIFAILHWNQWILPVQENQWMDSCFLVICIKLDFCVFTIQSLQLMLLARQAIQDIFWEDSLDLHNSYSRPKCKEKLWQQLQNLVLVHMFVIFHLCNSSHNYLLRQVSQNFQKEYFLSSHLLIYQRKRLHAYPYQFLLLHLFDKTVGMNVIHRIFVGSFHLHHSRCRQNKHILEFGLDVYQLKGRSSIFFWRVWKSMKATYEGLNSLHSLGLSSGNI